VEREGEGESGVGRKEMERKGITGLWSKTALLDRPAADFFVAGCEVVLQAELEEPYYPDISIPTRISKSHTLIYLQ
jgi:hypothetical protein